MTDKIRMYPLDTCAVVNGVRIAHTPSREEVLAYFAHPSEVLQDFQRWKSWESNQRTQLQRRFTAEEVASVHPVHRSWFIVYDDYMAKAFPFRKPGASKEPS